MGEYMAADAPPLTEWLTASQVADELDMSRQSVNRKMNRGDFKTLKKLGERPIYVVAATEVAKIKKSRAKDR